MNLRLIVLALALSGCAKDEAPQVVMVEPARQSLELPGECTSKDPAWTALPGRDVTQAEAARNYAENKRSYRKVLGRRSICRAAIVAAKRG